ncbi:MAG: exodeoxyribonuclease VII large subunit [Pseudobdellovibrionaceae bacterium]
MSDDLFSVAETRTNAPEMSVSDLALSLKRTLEDAFGRVRVRGELSRVKIHSSGHLYSDLKDENAVINVICWRGQLATLSIRPEEGLDVICTGRITTYPARSNYQMIIEEMELAGEGALLKMLEDRKKRLAAEGLFDPSRKKQLPYLPETIGVVTSETGAVIRDILHRISDRFPVKVVLWPVPVQGEGAAAKIAAAIRGFEKLAPKPDLLIVGRGGGSLEDLMPFNDEDVVRAAAESTIPLISAVGHETDTTLIDFAADKRAPTPTGAAEMAVPERLALLSFVADAGARAANALRRKVAETATRLEAQVARLGTPERLLETKTQRLDQIADRLSHVFSNNLHAKHNRLMALGAQLTHPKERLNFAAQRLENVGARLLEKGPSLTDRSEKELNQLSRMLESLSFKSVLQRGYVVVRDAEGKAVTKADSVLKGQKYDLEFADNGKASVEGQ